MSNESSNQNTREPAAALAVKLARESAFAHCNEHPYLPQTREQANSWQPHEWVVAAIHASALIASLPVGHRFQADVADWMHQCFLPSLCSNMTERGDRLLEEVLELLQAHGYDSARVPTLVNYVFGRPVGEPAQEVGGVMVTLAAYCSVAGLSMQANGQAELDRINQPEVMARIRAKQEAKNALHFDTPLPGNAAQPSPAGQGDARAQFEAWMDTQSEQGSGHVMAMVSPTDNRYQSPVTSSMWSAWQAANAAREGGLINGWRMIDGVRVFSASAHASIVDDQQYVRYDDYLAALAARQPVGQSNPLMAYADSYRRMANLGSGRVSCLSVAYDIETNMAKHAAPPAQAVDLPYSLDADPAGIRARVCDVITGTLMVGAQGHTPPPAGHWAEPFWKAARADAAAQAEDLGTGVQAIACERERQLRVEGFSPACDAHYIEGELARAATAYAQLAAMDLQVGTRSHIASHEPPFFWPWAPEWWKPVDARRDLVRAGALIAAQIDLIDSQAVGNG